MFFPNVLKYLDEALDDVTGRYAAEEDKQSTNDGDIGEDNAEEDQENIPEPSEPVRSSSNDVVSALTSNEGDAKYDPEKSQGTGDSLEQGHQIEELGRASYTAHRPDNIADSMTGVSVDQHHIEQRPAHDEIIAPHSPYADRSQLHGRSSLPHQESRPGTSGGLHAALPVSQLVNIASNQAENSERRRVEPALQSNSENHTHAAMRIAAGNWTARRQHGRAEQRHGVLRATRAPSSHPGSSVFREGIMEKMIKEAMLRKVKSQDDDLVRAEHSDNVLMESCPGVKSNEEGALKAEGRRETHVKKEEAHSPRPIDEQHNSQPLPETKSVGDSRRHFQQQEQEQSEKGGSTQLAEHDEQERLPREDMPRPTEHENQDMFLDEGKRTLQRQQEMKAEEKREHIEQHRTGLLQEGEFEPQRSLEQEQAFTIKQRLAQRKAEHEQELERQRALSLERNRHEREERRLVAEAVAAAEAIVPREKMNKRDLLWFEAEEHGRQKRLALERDEEREGRDSAESVLQVEAEDKDMQESKQNSSGGKAGLWEEQNRRAIDVPRHKHEQPSAEQGGSVQASSIVLMEAKPIYTHVLSSQSSSVSPEDGPTVPQRSTAATPTETLVHGLQSPTERDIETLPSEATDELPNRQIDSSPVRVVTERDRAKEEAWAAARMMAEGIARAQAMKEASTRENVNAAARGLKHQEDPTHGAVSVKGGSSAYGQEEYAVPISSGAESVVKNSPEHESIANGATRGAQRMERPEERSKATSAVKSGRLWRALIGNRNRGQPGPPSESSAVSSQVSNVMDPLHPPRPAVGVTEWGSRRSSPAVHDFHKLSRHARGNGREPGDGSSPAHECAACLGLWDGGGGAVNRWYRCTRCGGTVHGACRQFFEAGEPCVEAADGGESNSAPFGPHVGWRPAVNRAGVIQVGVLQVFKLALNPGESVYVALRLLPWKERVKTGSAVYGDLGASWPTLATARHDLLHLYNSDATPLPTLRVEIWRSAMRVLDDLLGYTSISMAPLLARPLARSERWHVLFHPKDEGAKGASDEIGPITSPGGSLPPRSGGTILLSIEFIPTGTPGTRPLPLVVPPPSRSTRISAASPKTSSVMTSEDKRPSPLRVMRALGGTASPVRQRQSPARSFGSSTLPPANAERGHAVTVDVAAARASDARSVASDREGLGDGRDENGWGERSGTSGPAEVPAARVSTKMMSGHHTNGGSILEGERKASAISQPAASSGTESGVVVNEKTDAVETGEEPRVHLFRVKSYTTPVWCEVCHRLLLGVRNQGFRCEACGMSVHPKCQLRANFSQACPGEGKKRRQSGGALSDSRISGKDSDDRTSRELEEGVGIIQIHLRSAHRCGSMCRDGRHNRPVDNHIKSRGLRSSAATSAKRSPFDTLGSRGNLTVRGISGFTGDGTKLSPAEDRLSDSHVGFFRGDHYCRMRVGRKGAAAGKVEEVRTEAVFQTSNPLFDRTWVFPAPSYDSLVTIDLVDATTDRPVGRFETSIIGLLQADYDARAVGRTPPSQELSDRRLLAPGAVEDEENVTGLLQVRLEIDEDTEALFGPSGILGLGGGQALRRAPPRQKAELGVESLKALVARVKGIILWFKMAKNGYSLLMSWENPALSSISMVIFVYLCLVANAEYVLAFMPFSLLIFMTWGFLQRRKGGYVQGWIASGISDPGTKGLRAAYRPVGQLKVAVVKGRGLISSDLNLPGNAYVRVTYVPQSNLMGNINASGEAETAETSGPPDLGVPAPTEYLVGQTAPYETSDSPEWGRVGGRVGGSLAGTGAGFVPDQTRGVGDFSGQQDALLQKNALSEARKVGMLESTRVAVVEQGPLTAGVLRGLAWNMTEIWSREPTGSEYEPSAGSWKRRSDQFIPPNEEHLCFVYPLLQPLAPSSCPTPWSASTGFLRFSVYFANPFNSMMDSEQGQVIVPLAGLAGTELEGRTQPEIRGWFNVSPPGREPRPSVTGPVDIGGSSRFGQRAPAESSATRAKFTPTPTNELVDGARRQPSNGDHRDARNMEEDQIVKTSPDVNDISDGDVVSLGSLFLRLQLSLPETRDTSPSEEDLETSRALQTLLGEGPSGAGEVAAGSTSGGGGVAAPGSGGKGKDGNDSGGGGGGGGGSGGSGGSSGGSGSPSGGAAAGMGPIAVAKMLGIPLGLWSTVKDVQVAVESVLDLLETIKNLLNWTHPHKTALVYALVALVWVCLLLVPGRYLILGLGLYEFSRAWIGFEAPVQDGPPPLAVKLKNLLVSLPVDSELAPCYSWEARQFANREKAELKLRQHRARLKLLGAGRQWEGTVRVHERAGDPWEVRYLVVLGHRLAWWGSPQELDDGRKARAQLLLQGHAGVTQMSPLELREIENPRKVVCVFGRSPDGMPLKVSFLAESVAAKEELESAVSSVVETKRD